MWALHSYFNFLSFLEGSPWNFWMRKGELMVWRLASRHKAHSSRAPNFWKHKAILCMVSSTIKRSLGFFWNCNLYTMSKPRFLTSIRVCAFYNKERALSYWSLDMKCMALSLSSCRMMGTSSLKVKARKDDYYLHQDQVLCCTFVGKNPPSNHLRKWSPDRWPPLYHSSQL